MVPRFVQCVILLSMAIYSLHIDTLSNIIDCVAAEPVIMDCMKGVSDSTILVECLVERSEYKGNSEYFYRKHPKIKLTCVPTLLDWSNPSLRLDDKQSANKDLVQDLIGYQ